MHSRSAEVKGTVGRMVVSAQVGAYVELDSERGENLLPCTDWDQADFRFPDPVFKAFAHACNVHVTGRKIQYAHHVERMRCQVEWVKDGELNETSKGWLYLDRAKKEYPE